MVRPPFAHATANFSSLVKHYAKGDMQKVPDDTSTLFGQHDLTISSPEMASTGILAQAPQSMQISDRFHTYPHLRRWHPPDILLAGTAANTFITDYMSHLDTSFRTIIHLFITLLSQNYKNTTVLLKIIAYSPDTA